MLLPALGVMGAAFYWGRAEKVSSLGGSEMFVERVELKTAPGRSREAGASHSLVVTIDHPWPKPRFWSNCCSIHGGLTSFKKTNQLVAPVRGSKVEQYIASLGEVIWSHGGKSEIIRQFGGPLVGGNGGPKDGKYVFVQDLDLRKIGPEGDVTFHGAFVVAGRPALEMHRVIRKAGEKLTFDQSHYTGGNLVSVTAGNWMTIYHNAGTAQAVGQHMADVVLRVRSSQKSITHLFPLIYNVELVDGHGRVYPSFKGGFWTIRGRVNRQSLLPNEVEMTVVATLAVNFRPPNPLTLRGKVSIDDNWPVPFSVKLQKH